MSLSLLYRNRALFALLVLCFTGCEYEEIEWKSNLGLSTPCIPSEQFFVALETFVSDEITTIANAYDLDSANSKYELLAQLFRAAEQEATDCHFFEIIEFGTEIDSEPYWETSKTLLQLYTVSYSFQISEKAWEDSDIEIFRRGLSGVDLLKEDTSWLESIPCDDPCDDET